VSDSAALARFYEDAYSRGAGEGARYARWRALGAVGKADHVVALCRQAGLEPAATLQVGCGDGALLAELARRGFGGRLAGVEIADAAVQIARRRPEIDAVELYDGSRLPAAVAAYDLGVLSHVLEHVRDPAALLAETARACRAVVVEVPLEANVSARRASRRAAGRAVGHLQRFDRDGARALAATAGLRIAGELEDPLPLAVHRFFAASRRARAAADLKWLVRSGLHALAPGLARRLFTVHYACLCLPDG
jgi:SAM-dependent methyltransferase